MRAQRTALAAALVVTALVLQLVVVDALPLPGGNPDLLLLVVVALAVAWGSAPGMGVGFAAGLLLDIAPPADGPLGRWAILLCLVGYATGMLRDEASRSAVVMLVVVAVMTALVVLGYVGIALLFGDERVIAGQIGPTLLATVLYDVLLAPFVVPPVVRLARRVSPEPVRR